MQEQHIADKAAVAVGTFAAWIIGLDAVNTVLAIVLALASLVLIGYRIAIARREWRDGRKSPPAE